MNLPNILINYVLKFLSTDLYLEYYYPKIFIKTKLINKEIKNYKLKYGNKIINFYKKCLDYNDNWNFGNGDYWDYIDNELPLWMNERKSMMDWYTPKCINITRRLTKLNPNLSITENLDNYWNPPFNSEKRIKRIYNILTISEMISLFKFFKEQFIKYEFFDIVKSFVI